jgi:hypothetical protein
MINFVVQEFVPPEIYTVSGEATIHLIHPAMIAFIESLRANLGKPITINNWHRGGPFKYRGFRPENCGVGAGHSAHLIGKALDFDVEGSSSETVREYLVANKNKYPMITRLEDSVNWVHADCMPIDPLPRIHIFMP